MLSNRSFRASDPDHTFPFCFSPTVGSGIQFGQASVLATELCHVRYRGPGTFRRPFSRLFLSPSPLTLHSFRSCTSSAVTLFNSTYYVGSMIAAWVTYGSSSSDSFSSNIVDGFKQLMPLWLLPSPALHMTGNWAWRLPVVLQAVSSILVLVFFYPAPESPRWLVSRGRNEEALELLARYVRPCSCFCCDQTSRSLTSTSLLFPPHPALERRRTRRVGSVRVRGDQGSDSFRAGKQIDEMDSSIRDAWK